MLWVSRNILLSCLCLLLHSFGAVIDESAFEGILQRCVYGL